jgi:anion-transporting  ArsA/GET3 family ATPase
VCIVATPEEMPVNETIELAARLENETNVALAAVIVNRVLPELFGRAEEEVFERLRTPAVVGPLGVASSGHVAPVLDAARLAVTLRRTGAEHLERLRAGLATGLPVLYVPELFRHSVGLRALAQVADALGAELGG